MEDAEPDPQLAELTAEMAWLRRLARALLRGDEAQDLAQDAWIVAAAERPADGRPLRPWLSRVVGNLARMRVRGSVRREARESASSSLAETAAPSPAELVQRVELQQLVASEVLRLDEPYRSTVLLHYFEELTCAEIARRLSLPEGTVRRRLKAALDEIRARIGARERDTGGLAVLAPLAGPALPSQTASSLALGAIAMKKVAAAVGLLVLILAAVLWTLRGTHSSSTRAGGADGSAGSSGSTGGSAGSLAGSSSESGANIPAWLLQPDVEPRRIAGRVTFRGAPVAGATVELASLASESGLTSAPSRTTTSTGEFDFGMQPAMPWSVRASAPGKSGSRIEVDLREPHAVPAPARLELQLGACTAAMFGTVRDASGGLIVNARIARLPDGRSAIPGGVAVTADLQGAYELCVEPRWPGVVAVEVSADGYAAITATMIVPGRLEFDFALVPEATIVGRVIRDDNGAPIPNAYVFVPPGAPGGDSTPVHGTFSDASGQFQLDGMTAGRHLVFARADGMSDSLQPTPTLIGVGQTSVDIEIRLEVGSLIRGTVVDHEQRPIGGARVVAFDPMRAAPVANAVSQDDGSFVLTGVPRTELRFTAQPYDVVKPTSFRVSRSAHEGVILEVEPLGTIIGNVVRNKQPLPGANIHLRGPNDKELQPMVADASGRFEARGLRPGPWTVAAEDTRIGAFGSAPETVVLGRGETKEVTVDVSFAASIAGRLVDQNGSPVPGVTVMFRHTGSDDAGQATTDVDGSFRAATMTGGGDYQPAVMRNVLTSTRMRPANGTSFPLIALADGSSAVTGVVLAVQLDHLVIAGKVLDGDGAPVSDARVIAELIEDNAHPRFRWASPAPTDTTNVDGQFSINDLSAGTYALRVRSASGVETTVAGIRAGRTDVTVVLPAPGAIEVTTVGFKTPPQVTAMRSGADLSAPTAATLQGSLYVLRSLSLGSYIVTARTATEAQSAAVEVTAGRTSRTTLTTTGSGVVAGHVRVFRTGKPVEGMACRALPRLAVDSTGLSQGEGVRTDAQGAFLITGAPAGQIAVACDGLRSTYSDGLRLITLQPSQRVDLDVTVVEWREVGGTRILASIGADVDDLALAPRLARVQPGGPAALAGFLDGDLIATVDGASVSELSSDGIHILIVNRPPGTKVKLGVMRGAKVVNGELTVAEAPF